MSEGRSEERALRGRIDRSIHGRGVQSGGGCVLLTSLLLLTSLWLPLLVSLAHCLPLQDACMAERLLDLMWQLTMSADSPPEVLQSNVITDVLMQYYNQVRGCC